MQDTREHFIRNETTLVQVWLLNMEGVTCHWLLNGDHQSGFILKDNLPPWFTNLFIPSSPKAWWCSVTIFLHMYFFACSLFPKENSQALILLLSYLYYFIQHNPWEPVSQWRERRERRLTSIGVQIQGQHLELRIMGLETLSRVAEAPTRDINTTRLPVEPGGPRPNFSSSAFIFRPGPSLLLALGRPHHLV